MSLKEALQERFHVTAISAQVMPLHTHNEEGEPIEARQIAVLDAEDRFMFLIGHNDADKYVDEHGYVKYNDIFKDYIFTEEQWEHFSAANDAKLAEEAQK